MIKEKLEPLFIKKNLQNAYIMLYFYDQVVMGQYKDGTLDITKEVDDENLTEIHIFNQDIELRGATLENLYEVRDTKDYMVERMYLIGNQSKIKGKHSVIKQNGREIIMPFVIQFNKVTDNKMKLIVHHLFDDNGDICGYRLAGIEKGD